jgi:hypothetical protein
MLTVAVPLGAQVVLFGLCLGLWVRLRRTAAESVCQWLVVLVAAEAAAQVWRLGVEAPQPAGVVWLVHLMCSYLLLYVVQRLADPDLTSGVVMGCGQPGTALAKSEYQEEE